MKKIICFLFCFLFSVSAFASQNALVVPDGTGAAVRAGFNNGLNTLVTLNSGPTAPTTTYPYMLWVDTTNNLLKIMNSANTAWITVGTPSVADLGLQPALSPGTTSQYLRGDLTWQTYAPMLYPGAGVPNSTGTAWGTSYTVGASANDLVQLNSSGKLPAVDGSLLTNVGAINYVAQIVDQETSGTAGGSATANTWVKRTLNTVAFDPHSLVSSLSSSQFVLGAGTYVIEVAAPSYATYHNMARLQNVTGGTYIYGTSEYSGASVTSWSRVLEIVTLAANTTFEVDHWCSTPQTGNDFGVPVSISGVPETYTTVKVTRIQ